MTKLPEPESRTLIDELLQEQQLLTAVTRFAQKHQRAETHLQNGYYRDLLPLAKPAPGEQYAFEVDLDRCSGCKACVAACHTLNGLEPDESWRSVGLLVTDDSVSPVQQTVTTACHHCVDPACLNGCPVLAYEKDPETGIVRHLDDQCIGCQYCVLKCPYEVPRYSERLGIVRKCDMCHSRLKVGEAPACVQSCPSEAIRITVVGKAVVASQYLTAPFLPATPDPAYTLPATRYVTTKEMPARMRAADEEDIRPAPAHWPLVFMLVLTQAGVGGIWFQLGSSPSKGQILTSAVLVVAGLLASILHLGRPLQAWRAFIGVRRSWLSREIVAFGALAQSVLLLLVVQGLPLFSLVLPVASLAGAGALLCSIMVYVDTPREFWGWKNTLPRFLGTALLLGSSLRLLFDSSSKLYLVVATVAGLKLASELNILRHLAAPGNSALKRTALLLTRALLPVNLARYGLLLSGGLLALFGFLLRGSVSAILPVLMALLLFAGEIAERYLFFRSVAQPKMPGGVV